MPQPRNKRTEIIERRSKVARRYLEGQTQNEIATALGVSQKTVCFDLEATRNEWLEKSIIDFGQAKADELAKIDQLEREYWAAWERSKMPKETKSRERSLDDDKRRLIREGQTGNPAYLKGVEWCISKRCELLHLDDVRLEGELPGARDESTVGETAAMDATILPPWAIEGTGTDGATEGPALKLPPQNGNANGNGHANGNGSNGAH